ncbi:MAG: ATP-binding protein [Bacillota bacterium]|nr:ATP-binding protein [Bacillota bacterium]
MIEKKVILAVQVPEVEPQFKPCYYRPRGLYHGAYVRVGDSERPMTEYEVYLAVSSRTQPAEDRRPVAEATLDDLDPDRLEAFLQHFVGEHPALQGLANDRMRLLRALNILTEDREELRPTLAGFLVFGRYPQAVYPSLVITVSAYGSDRPDPAARAGADVRCEGPLIQMLEEAMQASQRFMRSRILVTGLLHESVPEYPLEALREALVNAVVHRDYSRYALGTQVQVRFFPDRVEIQNPGGLYGPVTVELLGELGIQSTRNAALARMLEELGAMENRGTGVAAMAAALRRAHLSPPEFYDGRTYFRVTFRNVSLLSDQTVRWLNRFADRPLVDRQRLALAYARHFGRITNREYRLLGQVDSRQAARELKELVAEGLLETVGRRGGTYYVLSQFVTREDLQGALLGEIEERVLGLLRRLGPLRTGELAEQTGLSRPTVARALRRLMSEGLVEPTQSDPHAPNRRYRLRGGT